MPKVSRGGAKLSSGGGGGNILRSTLCSFNRGEVIGHESWLRSISIANVNQSNTHPYKHPLN